MKGRRTPKKAAADSVAFTELKPRAFQAPRDGSWVAREEAIVTMGPSPYEVLRAQRNSSTGHQSGLRRRKEG